jgi:hypothetical protein
LDMKDESLTLTGDRYSFCNMTLKNSHIYIGARLPTQPPMRIYIDSPENCGGAGTGNLSLQTTSDIVNLNSDPATLTIFVAGSPTIPTAAELHQTSATQVAMVVYAPYSECQLRNSAKLRGAMACKRASLEQTSSITWDPLVGALTMNDIPPLFRRYSYVECDRITSPSPPNTGCA